MHIDFSNLPIAPNESRAARNFLGLSQSQAADKAELPAHKLKRFETGNYVPDTQFLEDLRAFFEREGYKFPDDKAPGAKAKARGDVFPAGVIGETGSDTEETDGFSAENQGKPQRPTTANVQYMRIHPSLKADQIDRIFDCIEANERAIEDGESAQLKFALFAATPTESSQAQAVHLVRLLAENGLLYARLMGRHDLLAGRSTKDSPKTVGDLLRQAMGDVQAAVVVGDKDAQARRQKRAEPEEVLQALVG